MSQLLQFAQVEAIKRANNKVGTVLLDTLYGGGHRTGLWALDTLIRPVQIFVFRAAAAGLGPD